MASAGPPELPDKLYFKIGEVAKIVGVKPYVLRYWETEFAIIRPGKTRSHHRLYRRRDRGATRNQAAAPQRALYDRRREAPFERSHQAGGHRGAAATPAAAR
jgi:hypothetical protein